MLYDFDYSNSILWKWDYPYEKDDSPKSEEIRHIYYKPCIIWFSCRIQFVNRWISRRYFTGGFQFAQKLVQFEFLNRPPNGESTFFDVLDINRWQLDLCFQRLTYCISRANFLSQWQHGWTFHFLHFSGDGN